MIVIAFSANSEQVTFPQIDSRKKRIFRESSLLELLRIYTFRYVFIAFL